MAGVLVLVWGTHHCLRAMYPVHTRDQLWKRKLLKNNNKYNYNYSPWVVHQVGLPGAHTPLTEVSTFHLNCSTCYRMLWTLTFFFFFYLFFLILYFFSFEFLFLFSFINNKETCDIAVTWQVTWCDIIGLKHGGRIWKMTSGYMYTTWWPWVGNEADMRL